MYNYHEEKENLLDFLTEEYTLFKRQQDLYGKYLEMVIPLSDCVGEMTRHAGSYTAIRMMQVASERAGVDEGFQLNDDDNQFVVEMHNSLVDFVSDTVIPDTDDALNNFADPDQLVSVLDDLFQNALQTALKPFQSDDEAQAE
ncbi:hypothetical protein [Ligilactobacillus saerimneri]|uniref:hypothetical protein n=1 Tax=Ligilactobacillus saerimneri TaxID=228229 RepID=UPI0029424CE0|nr:hypothetical protein [Ligilactobacillus saerimneri]